MRVLRAFCGYNRDMNDQKLEVSPDNETASFEVSETDAGTRLDAFLASRIDGWSRARLQRLIDSGDVLVNGKLAKPSYKVSASDQVEVELIPAPAGNFTPENIPLEIVFEDDHVIVINKPAGLVVHPAAGIHSGTLANALAYHFQQLSNAGSVRPGLVHRLDKDTSGLLVVAKTETDHENLADQFRAREVFKSYVAFTLLEVELKTGRTHQIRVHLSWLKHPVVGDELYGAGRDNNLRDVHLRAQIRKLKRQFLHAEQLGFRHPHTGEQVRFVASLPAELTGLLEKLDTQ